MTHAAASPRFVSAFGALALSISVLAACAPTPEPTPTPTALFASDEEAFAAAEETYRAYTDAANAFRAGDEASQPASYLTGTALEADIDAAREFEELGIRLSGLVKISKFIGVSATLRGEIATVDAVVCIDASETIVLDENGEDVTPQNRATKFAQAVTFVGDAEELLISAEDVTEGDKC